ncbi:hypothetical protein [Ammoniphilus sp. YIM 78166]|uniref:hypothetical protein n=1 Tax=Ammoniphilus sp. YIM 78166 TaxID=1644106 RepID=UPI0014305A77|nr:hypothetical protein [Ammoniphilus sp. YIM 78166]
MKSTKNQGCFKTWEKTKPKKSLKQHVRLKDTGSLADIQKYAKQNGAVINIMNLGVFTLTDIHDQKEIDHP